jgi:translocation and assembly module TamB
MPKVLRWAALVLAATIALLFAGLGLLQTRPGKNLLAVEISRLASNDRFTWTVSGLDGSIPFDMTVRSITVTDDQGTWLTLHDVAIDIDPAALLSQRLHLRLLRVGTWDQPRPPSGRSSPPAVLLRMVHLPFGMTIDRLAIEHLVLGPPLLGARVAARLVGNMAFRGPVRSADLDLHRIDGEPGKLDLRLTLTGAEPNANLQLRADDPTGIIADRLLSRHDHLPLRLTLDGDGPPSAWHAQLAVSAGSKARLEADLALAFAGETRLAVSAHADIAAVLPRGLAPLAGNQATLAAQVTIHGGVTVDRLHLTAAGGEVSGGGALAGDGVIRAHLHADLPDLSKFALLSGDALTGSTAVGATLSGSTSRPLLTAEFSASGVSGFGGALRSVDARVSAAPTGALDDPDAPVGVNAQGELAGLTLPKAGAVAARLGERIAWSLAATVDRQTRAADIKHLDLQSGGVYLRGSGRIVAGNHVAGTLRLAASASGFRTDIPLADALLGRNPSLAATLRGDNNGVVAVDGLVLAGGDARLAGDARLDTTTRDLRAAFAVNIPRLELLRSAIGGALTIKTEARGPVDRLQLRTELDGRGLVAGGAVINRLQLAGTIADLSRPEAIIAGGFRAGRLDGRMTLAAVVLGDTGLAVRNLRLTAAESTIAGDLRISLASGLVEGSLNGRFPDLAGWSAVAGKPLTGNLAVSIGLAAAGGGQGLDLKLDGTHLAVGGIAIGRLAANARLADIRRRPTGSGRVALDAVRLGQVDFATATATFESRAAGRFGFQTTAAGRWLSLAMAGDGGLVPGGGELRVARLSGTLDKQNFALEQPVELVRRGSEIALSRLALRLGSGRVSASGGVRGEVLGLTFNASDLPLAAGARLLGYGNVHGDLSVAGTLGGTLRSPRGHLAVTATGLAVAVARDAKTPRLGIAVTGDWDGRALALNGRVTGLHGDAIALAGSLPLVLTPAPFGIAVPPQEHLALGLRGGGEIGHLADLLPLGEDRLSGRFAADVSLSGAVAAPVASGRLQLSQARYENFASGAVLTNLAAEVVGTGDRFRLVSLSAADGAGGSLNATGSLSVGGADGAAAQFTADLANFRIAARDEVVATASGRVSVGGPLAKLRITAPLTVNRAEINLPTSLPPSVVVLKVTETGGRRSSAPAPPAAPTPKLVAQLDITLGLTGPVFVQGHGLDSQWNGRLRITGTTAAPKIAGTLTASRGSYALLGKSFRLTRGTITFDGSARIDPALDIVAEASAADITARAEIKGYASAPSINLTSTPVLPRDEILARVLFGSGLRQMTAGQGLELAQAAAALSGSDAGLLDRLRGGLGLDWLRLGQGPAGPASSILNPSIVAPTTQSTTAVSAGKFIAPGVSIGVTQGVSPPTSKVTVEVEVSRHVTVSTEAGQNSGTGIGVNYNYDY